MKIIMSHDVDHLYSTEHWLRDLVLEKLVVRSTINLLSRKISFFEWAGRCSQPFRKAMNHIIKLAEFDKSNGVPSTYFFGMSEKTCHGMSYKPKEAVPYIKQLLNMNFDCGVHGCEYQDIYKMGVEQRTFTELTGQDPVGIRMHYLRFNNSTFNDLAHIGYSFDSTEFDKLAGICVRDAYKIETMIEFPVCIMDSYLPYAYDEAKEKTIAALDEAKVKGIKYFTILFHDTYYGKEYSTFFKWYNWLIHYLIDNKFEFISFRNAMKEMESN